MISRSKKQKIVEELSDVIQKSQVIYFTGFSGLNVAQINEFRNTLRQLKSRAKVAKKTLAELSFRKTGLELDIKDKFNEPVMFEFGQGDPIALAKAIWQFSKKNEKLKILGGLLDNKILTAQEVIQLARIPSREVLLGRLVSSLASPIRNFDYVLKGNINKLVYVLKALQSINSKI